MLTQKKVCSCWLAFVLLGISMARLPAAQATGQDVEPVHGPKKSITSVATIKSTRHFTHQKVTFDDGITFNKYMISGPPHPPAGHEFTRLEAQASPESIIMAAQILNEVPAYDWVFGCSAVSAAMVAAYYDRAGLPEMYTGPTNGGVMPMDSSCWGTWSDGVDTYPLNPLIASRNGLDGRAIKGSIDDYWIQYGSLADDPYINGVWEQHLWGEAIGDFMKTSRSEYDLPDGGTWFYSDTDKLTCSDMEYFGIEDEDGTYGRKLFYEARGYLVRDCYSQDTNNIGGRFTYAMFKQEIDAGRPVLLNLAGHSVVGVGYDPTSMTITIHDTWDNNAHTMTWGGSYSEMPLRSVSIVHPVDPSSVKSMNVSKSGSGSGAVGTQDNKILCGADCSEDYYTWSTITLLASADVNSKFSGWTGCDSTNANLCTVTLTDNRTVIADFTYSSSTSTTTSIFTYSCIDNDQDGYSSSCSGTGGIDCDDGNPDIHPGAEEICHDNVDNNCDGAIDENCTKCFVVSMIGESHPAVAALRGFRDTRLARSAAGRKLIEMYYDNAPALHAALDRSPVLRSLAGKTLEAIAPLLE